MCSRDVELYEIPNDYIAWILNFANEVLGNPKEWRRHLDGCAYLIQAAGINGFSGKEEQALFWCFARMGMKSYRLKNIIANRRQTYVVV